MTRLTPDRERIAETLRAHGIRPTRQRVDIAHALFARCAHLSADRLLAIVNRGHAASSKATVYNTLSLLVERRLVRQVIVDPSKIFYDPNTTPHHHLYDVGTGELTDIAVNSVAVTGLPALPEGTVAESVDIVVRVRSGV